MLQWIGHTRLTLYVAYPCMGLQSAIYLARRLMQPDLCVSCLVTWSQEFLCSSAGYIYMEIENFIAFPISYNLNLFKGAILFCSLLMKLVIKLKEMSVMCGRWGSYHTSLGKVNLRLCEDCRDCKLESKADTKMETRSSCLSLMVLNVFCFFRCISSACCKIFISKIARINILI